MFKWLGKLFSAMPSNHPALGGYLAMVAVRKREYEQAQSDRDRGIDRTRTGASILTDEVILTEIDVARVLRVPVTLIREAVEAGKIPTVLMGDQVRFRSRDIQAFVNSLIRPA